MLGMRSGARWIDFIIFGALSCGIVLALDLLATPAQQQASQPPAQRTVVVTVDDLPGAEFGTDHSFGDLKELEKINHAIPTALRSHRVPAIGFVNEWKLQVPRERDARAALLQMWLDAGMTLGNHTYTHEDFQTTPIDQYEDDTVRGDVVTRSLMTASGQQEKYFRHPFLNTGPTAEAKASFEAFLKDRGYRVAPVTVEDADYMFNDVLGEAFAKKDKKRVAKTKKEYLEYVDVVFDFFEQASRDLFKREIPQVLLIHDDAINAECLDALLTKLEKRGYKFVSLDDALADPAYATPDLFIGGVGISWLTRWKMAFGEKPDYEKSPDPPKWIQQGFEDSRRAHSQH